MPTGRFNYNAALFWPTKGEVNQALGTISEFDVLFPARDGNPREDWTSPQGPRTVLEEMGGQGKGGVTGINIRALAGKYRSFIISSPVKHKHFQSFVSRHGR